MSRPSTLTLHRYRLGELSPDERRAVDAWLERAPEDRRRLQAQLAHRAAFELEPIPAALRSPSRERAPSWWRLPALGLAAAAALVLFIPAADPGDAGEATRIKGAQVEPAVRVLVEGRGELGPNDALRPGDRFQLRVPAGPWSEAWVGDGEAILGHFALRPGSAGLSPFALAIDAGPGPETVIVLLAESPLGEARAKAAMEGRDAAGVDRLVLRLPKAP